jgi:uncharacterized membrane protein
MTYLIYNFDQSLSYKKCYLLEMNQTYTLLKTAAVIFLVDIFWLLTGGIFARKMTERIQGSPIQMRYASAIIVYIFLAYMLLQTKSAKEAFIYGVAIYGVYDFTNHALLENYDWKFAIADTLWGGVLFVLARHLLRAF